MSLKRKKYSKQYKLDALQMYENGEKSMSQVERELGITAGLRENGERKLQESQRVRQKRFQGTGTCPRVKRAIRQLERENAQLRAGEGNPKKVLGIYSKDTR